MGLILLFSSKLVFHTNFHWSLRDRKSPQVSRTLLSIAQSAGAVEYTYCTDGEE